MRVRRISKFFAQPDQIPVASNNLLGQANTETLGTTNMTSKDLFIEQMRQQRQVMATQRLRQKIQAQERRDRLMAVKQAAQEDNKDDAQDAKNQIQVKKLEQASQDAGAKNVSLYKTRSRVTQPVPMK